MNNCLQMMFGESRIRIPDKKQHYLPQKFLFAFFVFLLPFLGKAQNERVVTGSITDSASRPLSGVTVSTSNSKRNAVSDDNGFFTIKVSPNDRSLTFTYVGMRSITQAIDASTTNYAITMQSDVTGLNDVVVVGYGTKRKQAITGSVATVTSQDISRVHGGATASTTLAGKLPGVTFRQAEGRPGSSAGIQIRNMGNPLYVIDGVQQDAGQFNNLAPNDIESITVLKDASAAVYGVRAANGVILVTTKKGTAGRNNISVDAYSGYQYFFRFPKVLTNTYDYYYYRADAEVNRDGFRWDANTSSWVPNTSITQDVLDAAKAGTDPQYRSFDWRSFILNNNGAPLNSVNVNISGGSDKVNYYVSGTNLYQNSVMGKEFRFNRTNIQSNVTAKLANGLRVGFDINGRVETRRNPGLPYGDDYWLPRLAVLANPPNLRPYANDNPEYLNDLGVHMETNYGFLNEQLSGKFRSDWRVLQTNFHIDWDIPWVKGLSLRGLGSYYMADELENNQEYTYKAYTYNPVDSSYTHTGGSTNPWRDREQIKQINTDLQLQISYNNTFGKHSVSATLVAERLQNHRTRNWLHASPESNALPLVGYAIMDQYTDEDATQARTGYVARVTYSYANKYFIEGNGRRDASYLFAPAFRVGYFPSISAGWRITEEAFMKSLLGNKTNILSDFKFRGSYGQLGDDRRPGTDDPIVNEFAFLPGYNYGTVGSAILDGNIVTAARDKGVPVTSISWTRSKITDLGFDFSLLNGKITGTFDWFHRKRTGLVGHKNDVVLPLELGYQLADENIESDAQYGEEGSLAYNGKIGQVNFTVGGNLSYTRSKHLDVYKPTYLNSLSKYFGSREDRFDNFAWGYIAIGQFTSQEQINNYPVNIDGQGNKTLLPGDIIYQDLNNDGKIDGYDTRPISYGYGTQPTINFGFNIAANYKGFDFHADFSGAAGYTWYQDWETRWAFQNAGNMNVIFEDRWHRENIYDPNSAWIPGKYPSNRYNIQHAHSDYNKESTFWLHNVKYIRARTIELGYSVPQAILQRAKIQRARLYVNVYNLFSIDNLREFGIDPELVDNNGLQFPQNKVLNIGINLSL